MLMSSNIQTKDGELCGRCDSRVLETRDCMIGMFVCKKCCKVLQKDKEDPDSVLDCDDECYSCDEHYKKEQGESWLE